MQKETLVIIFNPLQFLNAKSYKDQFEGKYKFIVLTPSKVNYRQIEKIDNKNYCVYPFKKLAFLNNELLWLCISIYTLLIKINKFDEVIIGNYNNIIGYLIALRFQKQNKNIILLDDGLATLKIFNDRNKLNKLSPTTPYGGRLNLLLLKNLFISRKLFSVIFYTSFDVEIISAPKNDKVRKQVIKYIDNLSGFNNEIWFIGSPLIESNILSNKEFSEYINKVKFYCKIHNLKFKYILHRSEKPKINLNCVKFDYPIELVLKESKLLPNKIFSFYSTALFNIATLFPSIDCYYINLYKMKSNLDNLESVYRLFESHSNLKEFTEL